MASPGGGISLQKNHVLGTYASWTVLFIVHNYSCQWNPFTMFFSLACLANCSKLVKLTHLETTEKKIEVWWKTKKNPKKYYWILNSKEPTPFFLKNYLFTLALFPSTLHFFQWQNQLAPNSCPPQTPSGRTACFTTPSPRGIHKDQQQNAIREGGWVYDCLSTFPSYPFVAIRLAGWKIEVNFSLGRAGLFWLGKWGGGEGFHDILVI